MNLRVRLHDLEELLLSNPQNNGLLNRDSIGRTDRTVNHCHLAERVGPGQESDFTTALLNTNRTAHDDVQTIGRITIATDDAFGREGLLFSDLSDSGQFFARDVLE